MELDRPVAGFDGVVGRDRYVLSHVP
jgi:hypothetical protein